MADLTRPHRDLCAEAELRDVMPDGKFWDHVLGVDPFPDDDGPDLDVVMSREPCAICGETGACAYDAEGLPLIHATERDDNGDET